MNTKEIIKAKTIEHYTHYFGLEDLEELGHGDKTMIDWGIKLIYDFISDGNADGTSVNSLHKHVVNTSCQKELIDYEIEAKKKARDREYWEWSKAIFWGFVIIFGIITLIGIISNWC